MNTAVIIGDSQAQTLLPHLTERLRARGIEVVGSHTVVGWSTRSFVQAGRIPELMATRPDLALIALGGNDTATFTLMSTMREFLEQVRSQNDPHIVWIGPAHSTRADVQRRKEGVVSMQRAFLPGQGVEWHDAMPMTRDLAHTQDGVHFPRTSAARWAARIDAVLFSSGSSDLLIGAIAAGAAALGLLGLAWLAFTR